MSPNQKSSRGKMLLVLGCVWFVLDFLWLPPLTLILGWFRFPQGFYNLLVPAEFVAATIMAAVGALLWRAASRRPSFVDYIIVCSCAVGAIVGVLDLYGWIHVSN